MKEALGLIEVIGLTNAVMVADVMAKTSNIKISDVEITRGHGYVTVKIIGDVGAVNAAISSGKSIAIENDKYITSKVIPRPANMIEEVFIKKEEKIKVETSKKTSTTSKKVSTRSNKVVKKEIEDKQDKKMKEEAKKEVVKHEEKNDDKLATEKEKVERATIKPDNTTKK